MSAHSFCYRLPKCFEKSTLIWLLMIWHFYFIQSVLRAGSEFRLLVGRSDHTPGFETVALGEDFFKLEHIFNYVN